jgi:hypothetical protein
MDSEFHFSRSAKSIVNFALLFFWVSLPLLAYLFLVSTFALISGQAVLNRAIVSWFGSLLGFFVVITVPLQIVNQYNRIRVSKGGLYVEVYAFRSVWKFIDWKDILDLKLLSTPDRWGKPQWLIRVKDLTYWHKWISWQHKCGFNPSILITSDLLNHEKLLKIIEKKLGTVP